MSTTQLIYAEEKSFNNTDIYSTAVDKNTTDMNETSSTSLPIAEEMKFYSIEIILFRHKDKSGLLAETWELANSYHSEHEANRDSIMAKYLVNEKAFYSYNPLASKVSIEQLQLKEQAEKIRYSKPYQLLTHFAWTQPGYNKEKAAAVKLVFPAEKNIQANIKVELARYLHTYVDMQIVEDVCRPQARNQAENLNDDISIKVETKLETEQGQATETQIETENLNIEDATDEQQVTEQAKPAFDCHAERIRFKQNRKMRSQELHYIDHPVFGLLVLITPVEVDFNSLQKTNNSQPKPAENSSNAPIEKPTEQAPTKEIKQPIIESTENKALDAVL